MTAPVTPDNIHILIIEDDKDTAWSTKRWLEDLKDPYSVFTVETAQTFASALVRLASGRAECVLLDLGLPDSPDETALVSAIRKVAPDVALIVVTGRDGDDLAQRVKAAGADDMISKPPNPASLALKIRLQVIYRRSDNARHKLEELLERYGTAVETAARAVSDSGANKFPPINPKETP